MARPKRQHYVPQFLLRSFATNRKPEKIWCFDKLKGEVRLQAIREVAHESKFYNHPALIDVGTDLEQKLGSFEGVIAPIISEIVESRSLLSVNSDTRATIIDFALVQLFRTRSSREFAKQGSVKWGKQELSEIEAKGFSLAALLGSIPKYRELCSNHIVSLRETDLSETFLLGDSVTLIIRTPDSPTDSLAAILPLATICVPISPALALMLFPSARESELIEAGEWYRPNIQVLTEAQPTVPGDVDSLNKMSVIAANRFVFSSLPDFTECKRVITACPKAQFGPIGGWEESRDDGN